MALASRSDRLRCSRVLLKSGVLSASMSVRLKMRLCRQYDWMSDDHDASCELRVLATGCRVKKGGNE